ncbi:protein Wnt-10a [Anoplophora glabripennis]|uniref:protein Wnt-10a n=1 Tax=Anoplophora glabripennis TaxID=217634 RepID=UPI0008747CA2|nr:protein Wnt-10a [Anoplophora glabripennis]
MCAVECKISQITQQQTIQSTFYSTYLDTTICRTVPGLTKSQIELCYRQPDSTLAAIQGLNQAVKECQHQFQGHRWNCSSLSTRGQNPYISAILQKGYKETAFAHAIASAGVVISVARGCSSGLLLNCGCDSKTYKMRKPRSMSRSEFQTSWKWGGCSHNLHYGVKFSKIFLDSREKAEDIHSKINLHNNQVGRMAVSNNMQVKCKCHGMSGSCELKTCWRATPDIRVIGKILKDRYRSAILVDQTNLGKKSLRKFNVINQKKRRQQERLKQWTPRKNKHKRDLSYDLLYYQKSPNFCERDQNLDVQGTAGRFCNRTSSSSDSCSNLCCGRGYNLIKQKRIERCKCKFHWCCHVECQTCTTEEWISICK